jgi:hypothetical protein
MGRHRPVFCTKANSAPEIIDDVGDSVLTYEIVHPERAKDSVEPAMRNDVCRRSTFGFTIENTKMRIWLCRRSMVVVTEPLNFVDVSHVFFDFMREINLARPHTSRFTLPRTYPRFLLISRGSTILTRANFVCHDQD